MLAEPAGSRSTRRHDYAKELQRSSWLAMSVVIVARVEDDG